MNQLIFKLLFADLETEWSFTDKYDEYDLNSVYEEIKLLGYNIDRGTINIRVSELFKQLTASEMVYVLNEALPYDAKLEDWLIVGMRLQEVKIKKEV